MKARKHSFILSLPVTPHMSKLTASAAAKLRAWSREHILTSIFCATWKQTHGLCLFYPLVPFLLLVSEHMHKPRGRGAHTWKRWLENCLLLPSPGPRLL